MARFSPGTGSGEGGACGRRGKGLLIHTLPDATGMPLTMRTTPANGDERAQVLPLLDTLYILGIGGGSIYIAKSREGSPNQIFNN
jgi:hypothetical protein